MLKLRRIVSLSLMLGTLGLTAFGMTSTATATDGTDQVVHPNSACTWSDSWYRNTDIDQVAFSVIGMIHFGFPLDVTHTAVCGIDRFNLTNTNGLRDLDVRLNNQNPDGEPRTVTCTAYSLRPDGTVVKSVSQGATFTGTHRIDFGGALNQSVSYGAYAVECELPRLVTLNNILQREY